MIGMFDSGVGGLSVLRHLRRIMPAIDIQYVADRERAPYGHRPLEEVKRFSCEIASHLLSQGADMVVVACNSASAAALHELRAMHPEVPFVGMEPAVKPAASMTQTNTVGVLTTAATFQGELFASVVDRFATDVSVVTEVCDGWVEAVENGHVDGPDIDDLIAGPVRRLTDQGADTLVLGCTHYPFLTTAIRRVAGPRVRILDPGPAVARQARRVANRIGVGDGTGGTTIETTGPSDGLEDLVDALIGLAVPCETVIFNGDGRERS